MEDLSPPMFPELSTRKIVDGIVFVLIINLALTLEIVWIIPRNAVYVTYNQYARN